MERQCQVQAPRPGRDWVDVRRAGWSTPPPPLPATKPKWTAPDGAGDGRHGDQGRTTWDSPAISLEPNDVSGGLRCRRCRRGRQDRGKGQRGVASWVVRLDHRRCRRRFWVEAKRSSVAGPCEGPCHLQQGLKERGAQQQQQGQSRRLRSDVLGRPASDRPSTARAEGSGPDEPGETFWSERDRRARERSNCRPVARPSDE
jgi:hypothetical protein